MLVLSIYITRSQCEGHNSTLQLVAYHCIRCLQSFTFRKPL